MDSGRNRTSRMDSARESAGAELFLIWSLSEHSEARLGFGESLQVILVATEPLDTSTVMVHNDYEDSSHERDDAVDCKVAQAPAGISDGDLAI
jgi:hypothetical protein